MSETHGERPNRHIPTPRHPVQYERGDNGPQYILPNYEPSMGSRLLQTDEIVQSANGRFYTVEEVASFPEKSNAWCPTYGNCTRCHTMGPVGQQCNICDNGRHFVVVMTVRTDDDAPNLSILDARHVAKLYKHVGEQEQFAHADHTWDWRHFPKVTIPEARFRDDVIGWRLTFEMCDLVGRSLTPEEQEAWMYRNENGSAVALYTRIASNVGRVERGEEEDE